jgi:hypothetical protein
MRSWGLAREGVCSGRFVEVRGGQGVMACNGGMDTLLSGERNASYSAKANWRECSGVERVCQ